MKRTAKLTIVEVEHRGSQRYIIDCAHGTTEAVFKPGGSLTEQELIAAMVERHSARERCRCATALPTNNSERQD